MALKLLKGVWFLSMLVALVALLYVYAGLPQEVIVQDEGGETVIISNEAFFYTVMFLMAIANVMVYAMAKVFKKNEDLRTWFYGLVTTLNIFFVIGMNMISLYNSNEKYDFARIDFIIYGSVALIVLWAISWPVYSLFKRFLSKSTV
jgi:cytochrome c biogenesis factor